MATQGGFGMVVSFQADTDTPLETIVNVLDGEIPEFEKFLADSTSHGSAGGYSEFIATGQRQMNSFKLTLGWDPADATHAALVTAFDSDSPVAMKVQDPNGDEVISFNAHIQKLGRVSKMKDMLKCEVTIQPTGQPTIT